MTIAEEAEKIIYNLVAWVEVNRELRPGWVKENFSSMVIQSCKVFRDNRDKIDYYTWKWAFKAKNLEYTFDEKGRLIKLAIRTYDIPSLSGFLDTVNKTFKDTLESVAEKGLPSSVTQILIDRLHRVKTLGFPEPDNVPIILDMRRLDMISFKPVERLRFN